MFDLSGKRALVTGASGGIGGAIASALHGAGALVGLSGTRRDPLDALQAELGARAHVLPCNLGDKDAVEALDVAVLFPVGVPVEFLKAVIALKLRDESIFEEHDPHATADVVPVRDFASGQPEATFELLATLHTDHVEDLDRALQHPGGHHVGVGVVVESGLVSPRITVMELIAPES